MNLFDLLFGRRLTNREGMQRNIGWFAGVPAMGLDALRSSSCGPEAALTIMIPLAAAGQTPPRLVMVPAPYRQIYRPLLDLVAKIDADTPGRSVAIIIPELVLPHWWQRLLHGRRAERLRAALMEHAEPRLMIVTAPWRG